jgi:trehalose synthase
MQEVAIAPTPLDRLASQIGPVRTDRLDQYAIRAQEMLAGRKVWNINATATGGGVAEMLQALLAYGRGAGVDTRWLVLDGTPEFFRFTKRLHNLLHGSPGDGGPVGEAEHRLYVDVLTDNLEYLRTRVRPDDIVILHDPQTAGLAEGLRELGVHVLWRCHVGRDESNEFTDRAWSFLRPYVDEAQAVIFSRKAFVPEWIDPSKVCLIPPSLDPFSAKNREIAPPEVASALRYTGIVDVRHNHGSLDFVRRDGTPGRVRRHSDLVVGGPAPDGARLVVQVSRWDRLKDMTGVLTGFADNLSRFPDDVHLMLVAPDVIGVSDDPEGREVLEQCIAIWQNEPESARRRIHLCSLPMDDVDENAHLVNAIQRRAAVVVQKSLVEGFGLTVTEPMWKARPVLASRVGGIKDQIVDGESGVLLDDPYDLDGFATQLDGLLRDGDRAERLGNSAHERVRELFLGDRHLIQYVDLFSTLGSTQVVSEG